MRRYSNREKRREKSERLPAGAVSVGERAPARLSASALGRRLFVGVARETPRLNPTA